MGSSSLQPDFQPLRQRAHHVFSTPQPCGLNEAHAYCRRLARAHYENFIVAHWLMPRPLRQHFCNLYAYCRWADDLADEHTPGLPGDESLLPAWYQETLRHETHWLPRAAERAAEHAAERAAERAAPTADSRRNHLRLLDWWEQQLVDCYDNHASHPVFVALADTIRAFDLPREPLADLLVAFRQDQRQVRYATFAELHDYCRYSANPVGRLVLCLGRCHDAESASLSDAVCTGLQLANFCQDVARDFERGRIYFPLDECRQFGYTEDMFARRECNAAFLALMRCQLSRAADYLSEGWPLVDRVPGELRVQVSLFIRGGLAILEAIERQGCDVWARRPRVGSWSRLMLFLSACWSPAAVGTRRSLLHAPRGSRRGAELPEGLRSTVAQSPDSAS